jgi:hypothetical protein
LPEIFISRRQIRGEKNTPVGTVIAADFAATKDVSSVSKRGVEMKKNAPILIHRGVAEF